MRVWYRDPRVKQDFRNLPVGEVVTIDLSLIGVVPDKTLNLPRWPAPGAPAFGQGAIIGTPPCSRIVVDW